MKTSIWDVLTGIILLGILCMLGGFGMVLVNPNMVPSTFRPGPAVPTVVEPLVLPSPTFTVPGPPATSTPTPGPENTQAPLSPGGLRPSSTPIPTNTVVVLPSFTPSKTARSGVGGGSCTVTFQDPADNTYKAKGSSFEVHWTIKNTSTKTWQADSVDIRFSSGDRMHTGNDVRDMPYDVVPGGTLDLIVSMNAPATPGAYTSNWQLVQGTTTVCSFYLALRVN